MSAPVLAVQGLVAGYGGTPVVHGIDLTVGAGEVVTLLGGNGAGKTTTLLTISGLLPRLGGSVELFGSCEPLRRRARPGDTTRIARSGLAHVPEDRGLFGGLTVRENLALGRPRGVPREAVDEALDHFGALRPILGRRAGLLSGGEQQMLALARALVSRPRLLVVDEMSLGLAPIVVEQLVPVLRSVANETGAGVLVVEQHVALVLEIADRGYVMTRGRISLSGTGAELVHRRDLLEAGYLGEAAPGATHG